MGATKISHQIESFDPSQPLLINQDASETLKGVIQIATQVETDTGTDNTKAITPDKLANYSGFPTVPDATELVKGKIQIATQQEVLDATDATKAVVPAYLSSHETVTRTIYVTTTGNDTTGNGSIGTPYLTIGKALSTIKKIINSSITITINIGIGTFALSMSDFEVLSSISGSGSITLLGTYTLIKTGFTVGAAVVGDTFTYNVSGGDTGAWTTDQFKYFFLKVGANYYPITNNATTPTLSTCMTGLSGAGEIYEAQTIINFTNTVNTNLFFNIETTFSFLQLVLAQSGNSILTKVAFTFTNCYVSKTTAGSLTFGSNSPRYQSIFTFSKTIFKNIGIVNYGTNAILNQSYFYMVSGYATGLITFGSLAYKSSQIANIVVEQLSTSATSCGLYILTSGRIDGTIKFLNIATRSAFNLVSNYAEVEFQGLTNIILVNTAFLIACQTAGDNFGNAKFSIPFSKILGTPNTRYINDSISTQFVNTITSKNLQIPGLIYPEIDQNLTASLTNNTTTNVIVGNKLQNKSIQIDYTLVRGTGYRQGTITIINDGTNLIMSPDNFIDNGVAEVSEANLAFSVNYNTNEIRLAALLSNSGNAAALSYNVSRVMITPLTI